ncbi:hemerythrin domain-containing protein [Ovoidimarina sediminis]|uniref:hemerythrin domain-containing protein n=1 Tax=Ovoidimarina sediminis TaxID=3079856 RepID=UPI002910D35E|nr:hemerythrin domain-containing protein [Rhodophyticola sp. MJ-SS7]MDU8943856.1 hemerythrin domain-containing protein [Rhodophyticola sp. MJ-SS7]
MTHPSIHTRDGWPEEAATLLADYPRDLWPGHPHFARSIQNWMGAHRGFRQLSGLLRDTAEGYLDRDIAPEAAAGRLGYYGDILVRNLHGHHTWEDRSFFPEIRAADQRFDRGLETLESDHDVLDETLEVLTGRANRVIKLIQLDEPQARGEAGALHESASRIERFLDRHLTDEEDLVVPILLHHRMRG